MGISRLEGVALWGWGGWWMVVGVQRMGVTVKVEDWAGGRGNMEEVAAGFHSV